eukprot:TRINITY_DN43617_c0_g1_i1.p1 TRINITY_DN43617_c0_g1~~TRINITY_DN43617_c0_g1_i1.p1  ORF type:complete len:147 (-),score=16.68 TRINITY_DN43617_c0_g1_i1:52-492(-)
MAPVLQGPTLFVAASRLWTPELWHAAFSLNERPLRIHVATEELWADICQEDWGYAYHLERWFRSLVKESEALTTTSSRDADFVYVPHCAMNVYFNWKQSMYSVLVNAEGQDIRTQIPPLHGTGDVFHAEVLEKLDADYFVDKVAFR